MIHKPNFLIVGAAKSGSTSLYQYLSQHPEVFMPVNKEPNYFVAEYQQKMSKDSPNYKRSINRMVFNKENYYELFQGANLNEKAIGEATVTYLYKYNYAIPRIKEELGNLKIIIILRNPILRAFSQYSYIYELGFEKLCFEDALIEEKERLNKNWASTFAYVDQGMFYEQVKAYKKEFKNVHVLLLEDLIKNENKEMSKVFNFLSVDSSFEIVNAEKFNTSGVPKYDILNSFIVHDNFAKKVLKKLLPNGVLRKLNARARSWNQGDKLQLSEHQKARLVEVYREDINKLSVLIDKDLSHWLTFSN